MNDLQNPVEVKKNINIKIPWYEIILYKKYLPRRSLPEGLESLSFSFGHDGELDHVKASDILGEPIEIDPRANAAISFISMEVKKRLRFGVWERW